MNSSGTKTLIDAMADGNHLRLVDHEIAGLLGWMSGSSGSREARELRQAFGQAGQDERVTERGFRLLDHALFDRQTLLEGAAGVGVDRSNDERRRRYRLLLSAFHPDRYPDRADWLTERSQIITIAYSRFKSGKPPIRPAPVVKPGPMAVRKRPRRFVRPPTKWLSRLARLLRQRFGGDPWLAQKIIGLFALVLILPLLSVLLDIRIAGAPTESHEVVEGERVNGLRGEGVKGEVIRGDGAGNSVASNVRSVDQDLDHVELQSTMLAESSSDQPRQPVNGLQGMADGEMMAPIPAVETTAESAQASAGPSPLSMQDTVPTPSSSSDRQTAQTDRAPASAVTGSEVNQPENSGAAPHLDRRALAHGEISDRQSARPAGEASAENQSATALAMNRSPAQSSNHQGRPSSGQDSIDTNAIPTGPNARSGRIQQTAGANSSSEGLRASSEPMSAGLVEAKRPDEIDIASANGSEEKVPAARGRLLLGPLSSHQIGALLQQYQLALEQADIETLSRLVGSEQAEALRARFPGLFESGRQHRVDLSILQSQRDGDQWVVQLQQEVDVSAIDRQARNFSHRAEFRFSPDPYAIQMIEMEF